MYTGPLLVLLPPDKKGKAFKMHLKDTRGYCRKGANLSEVLPGELGLSNELFAS